MSKIGKLYTNEIIKASKKVIFIIAIAIIIAVIIAVGGLLRVAEVALTGYDIGITEEDRAQAMEDELKWREEQLSDCENELYYSNAKPDKIADYYYASLEYWSLKLSFDAGIYEYRYYSDTSKDSYLNDVTNRLSEIYAYDDTLKAVLKVIKTEEYDLEENVGLYKPDTTYQSTYEDILKNKNYEKYINMQNELIDENDYYTEIEKQIRKENNNLLKTIRNSDISDRQWSEISSSLSSLAYYKVQLANESDESGRLSEDEKTVIKQKIAEIELGLKEKAAGFGSESESYAEDEKIVLILGFNVALVLVILVGAMSIAEEIQTGSIKALIIAPVKRHKIFTAKLLMLLTVIVIEIIAIYIGFLISNLLFNFGSAPIVFTFLGKARCINYYAYMALYVLLDGFKLLAYGIIALMLSTTLRNVGGPLGITLGLAFAVDNTIATISSMIESQILEVIVKFIPTQNFAMAGKVLQSQTSSGDFLSILTGTTGSTGSWVFSSVYFVVFIFLMLFISYQSFTKRDIK